MGINMTALDTLEDNKKMAKYLLVIAIVIEIVVASVGIFIGVLLNQSAAAGIVITDPRLIFLTGLSGKMSLLIFVVIGIIELTRVPLILSIYRGNSLWWKFIGSFFLLVVMFIAFETMLIGQIQINSYRLQAVTQTDNRINQYENKITNFQDEILKYKRNKAEIEKNYEFEKDDIDEQTRKLLEPLNIKKSDAVKKKNSSVDIEILDLKKLNKKLETLKEDKESDIKRLKTDLELEKNEIKNLYNAEKITIENKIDGKEERLLNLNDNLAIIKNDFSGRKRNSINKQIEALSAEMLIDEEGLSKARNIRDNKILQVVDRHDDKVEILEKDYNQKEKYINGDIGVLEKNIKNLTRITGAEIDEEINNIGLDISENRDIQKARMQVALNFYTKENEAFNTEQEEIAVLNNQITEYEKEISELRVIKIEQVGNTIIYKVATHLTFIPVCRDAKNVGYVSPKCQTTTQNIWFGLIAGIVAIAGTGVALASEVLRTSNERIPSKKRKNARYLMISILKFVRKPKIKIIEKQVDKIIEVTKIVTQDKVVYQEVPKIQEVIKKQIVYVPVPTAREDLIADKNKK
jgi:hypothetical protein